MKFKTSQLTAHPVAITDFASYASCVCNS